MNSARIPASLGLGSLVLALAGCVTATPTKTSGPGGGGSQDGGSGAGVSGNDARPSDREQLYFRVDSLIAEWDAAQSGGRDDAAKTLAARVGEEVDREFANFAAASRGGQGLRVQYLAVKALAFSKDRSATGLLVDRLGDRDGDLVSNALIALKIREDASTPLPPLVTLLRSPVPEIRRFAPLALANVVMARERAGMPMDRNLSEEATTGLVGLAQDRDPFVRLHVAKAMGALRRPETNDLLVLMLRDDHVRIRLAAAAALERIGDPRTFPKVVELLEASDAETQVLVRDVLVSYAERIQGSPLSTAEKTSLDVSPRAWDRWYAEHTPKSGASPAPAGTPSANGVR